MKRNLRLAMAGVGTLGILAVPIALVACGSSGVTVTAADLQYLADTRATSFGSQRLQPSLLNVIRGETLTFARVNASTFGIKVPTLPSGVYIQVKKDAASEDLAYTVSKGEISKTSTDTTVTVKTFAFNQEGADADAAVAILAAIDSTTLADTALKAVTVAANTELSSTVANNLGIRMPVLESNVSVKVQKNSNSAEINFTVTVGATNKTTKATITKFTTNRDAEDLEIAAAALSTLVSTTKSQTVFNGIPAEVKTPVTQGVSESLGLVIPTLPPSIVLQLQKGNNGTLNFSMSKNGSTKDVSVTITTFALSRDEADVDAAIAALKKADATTKDEATFKALAVEKKEFSPNLPEVAKKDVKNYLFFLGTTACPVCNTSLTGSKGRANYTDEQDINAYTGPFPTAALKLKSNNVIDEVFIWEDLAPGYGDAGDTAVPNGSANNFPWSASRTGGQSAETFKAVEKYLGRDSFFSPMLLVVKNGTAKIDRTVDLTATQDTIYKYIQETYFPTTTTT